MSRRSISSPDPFLADSFGSDEQLSRMLDVSSDEENENKDGEPNTVNDNLSKLLEEFRRGERSDFDTENREEELQGMSSRNEDQEPTTSRFQEHFEVFDDFPQQLDHFEVFEKKLNLETRNNKKEPSPKKKKWDIQKIIQDHADYMQEKVQKLNNQVNEINIVQRKSTDIFEGISIFVNGYTEPPALTLRELIVTHGGTYHCYYLHGTTTYVIASTLANVKEAKLRKGEIYIRPEWIVDSITAGKALPHAPYSLYEKGKKAMGVMDQFVGKKEEPKTTNGFLDARNSDFIQKYYARSRLHLISTLAQDMKDYVASMKVRHAQPPRPFDDVELEALAGGQSADDDVIFHVDLDCFFVSVGLRSRPELCGKPLAVTHSKGSTSNSMAEVASCSYEARAEGVKNGMLVKTALEHCPGLQFIPYQFEDYATVSRMIYTILASYTLDLKAVSCDEMYLNVTALCRQFGIGDPKMLAEHMRAKIRDATGCPASVGIGKTSLLARLATRHAKPNGIFWVQHQQISEFIAEELVKDLPGVGYQTIERINERFGDLLKCKQLQKETILDLEMALGKKTAQKLYSQCRGEEEDSPEFWETSLRKSVSCDINYGIRFTKKEEASNLLGAIAEELEKKLAGCQMTANAVTVKLMIKSADAPQETAKFMGHGKCETFTRTATISRPTASSETIFAESLKLFNKIQPRVEDLRGVGVTCGKLKLKAATGVSEGIRQMFMTVEERKKTVTTNSMGKSLLSTLKKQETKKRGRKMENLDGDENEEMREKIGLFGRTTMQNKEKIEKRRENEPQKWIAARGVSIPGIFPEFDKKKVVLMGRDEIENDFIEIVTREPTQDSVKKVQSILWKHLIRAELNKFKDLMRFLMEIGATQGLAHEDWYLCSNLILENCQQKCQQLFGAKMSLENVEFCQKMELINKWKPKFRIEELKNRDSTDCK